MFTALEKVLNAFSETTPKTNLAVQMYSLSAADIRQAREELRLADVSVNILKRIGQSILEEGDTKKCQLEV